MQFWQGETIGTVVIIVVAMILMVFVMASLLLSRGTREHRYVREGRWVGVLERVSKGRKGQFFLFFTVLIAAIGAVGTYLFSVDIYHNPLFVDSYEVNLLFILVVLSIPVFFVAFALAALRAWTKALIGGSR